MPTVLMREIALQKIRKDRGFCILMFDIDRFKEVNDTFGHLAGDAVLQQVSAAITQCCRPSDFIFRYGGEEVLIVLVDCDPSLAGNIAERIRQCIQDLILRLPDGNVLSVTASLGIAAFAGELDYEKLLARADQSLYTAKAAGRNQVVMDMAPSPDGTISQ
nr:GGDEF domain-containing protein [Paracidobacterium acidisoli]